MPLARTGEDVDGITLAASDPGLGLQRNPLSPISRLPAEILANIFIHNAHDSYIRETYGYPDAAAPSWVNVSYVCRHWRDIALNCQTLWAYIPTISQRWTQELLARSRKAPLKICTELYIEEFDDADRDGPSESHLLSIVGQLANHSQRIQELCLDLGDAAPEYSYQILSNFSSRLPCLQYLEISNLDLPEEESSFPLEGNTPALRTLMLDRCRMPWNLLELSALTILHLSFTELPLSQNITMAGFLAILRRMPHLVQLYVHSSLPRTHDFLSSREFDATPVINLSRLSNMSIWAPMPTINAFLSCVDIPLLAKIKLHCTSGFTHDDLTKLASLLARRINPSHDPTPAALNFRSLTIVNKRFSARLTFSTSEHRCSLPSSVFSHDLDENTHLQVYGIFARPGAILTADICRFIPLRTIRSVHFFGPFGSPPPLNSGSWEDKLALFPNVRYMKLSECHMPDMASMLSLSSHNRSGDQDGYVDGDQNEIFVPALETLELYKVSFSRVDDGFDLDSLCKAISTRKETQCRLVIKECRVSINGGFEALNLVGCWDDAQFKATHL